MKLLGYYYDLSSRCNVKKYAALFKLRSALAEGF